MSLEIKPVNSRNDYLDFVKFPWKIYKRDKYWVPPLIQDMLDRLDKNKNPFWKTAAHQCWLIYSGKEIVGRICAIVYHPGTAYTDPLMGRFGFFECVDDIEVAALLFSTAEEWLKQKGFKIMSGPYNPSPTDEIGIMVEGFDIRPVLLTGHNLPYYADLFTKNGFTKLNDTVARRYIRPDGITFSQALPEKLQRVAEIAAKRTDIVLRQLRSQDWENEISIATDIINKALSPLPDYIPVPYEEFLQFANGFKPFLHPSMAIIAEINGIPVGYAVALPDVYEALQKANGKLDLIGIIRFFFALQHLKRVSFKILMILPEFQGRGIEVLLVREVAKGIWKRGYREVDMSLAGEENIKSNRFTENLGFKVYLRYRIYERTIRSI
jgi:GNAT superfamily N-acetyltransferase